MAGYKTYSLAAMTIAAAIAAACLGWLETETTVQLVSTALFATTLRHGVAKQKAENR